jgi:aspartyl-tRNA synthetase
MLGRARMLVFPYIREKLKTLPGPAFQFVWITDFPLFSPDFYDTTDPGQGGMAGLRSTHHPFTAPKVEDIKRLGETPLHVKAQHYDLVVNGVELGGGSVRIHDADLQHYVLKEILKVCLFHSIFNLQLPDDRLKEFDHLLEALASGCPPHAGIALGEFAAH